MKSESVSEKNGGKTHVQRDPQIDHSYIASQLIVFDKEKSDYINKCGRYAEPHKKSCFTRGKEDHQKYDQE